MYLNLAKMRKERQIIQSEMAILIDCSTSNYSRREQGKIPFRINEMEIIQKFFDKPLDEIFKKFHPIKNSIKGD